MLNDLLKSNPLPAAWIIALAMLLAGFIAASAYWRGLSILRSGREDFNYLSGFICLGGLIARFLAAVVLFWMLLGWKQERFDTSDPRLFILVDSTPSMQLPAAASELSQQEPADQNATATRWQLQLEWFRKHRTTIEHLDKNNHLMAFEIGNQLKLIDPDDRSLIDNVSFANDVSRSSILSPIGSNIATLLRVAQPEITSAVIVFTDGNVNSGASLTNAAQTARDANIPLFFIGVGRPNRLPDLRISNVKVPEVLFAGDVATIITTVRRENTKANRCEVRLLNTGAEVLGTGQALFSEGQEYAETRIEFEIQQPGIHNLMVEVEQVTNESNLSNNSSRIRIDIRDNTLKVLLVSQYPSYEFRFLKQLLQRTLQRGNSDKPAFEVSAFLGDANQNYLQQDNSAIGVLPVNLQQFSKFDAVVLMDISNDLLPPSTQDSLSEHIRSNGAGLIVVAGPRNMPWDFANEPLSRILPVRISNSQESPSTSTSSVPFRWNPTPLGLSQQFMQLEQRDTRSELNIFAQLPANNWQFPKINPVTSAAILAVDNIDQSPLLLSRFVGAGRVMFQSTDETYRWRNFAGTNRVFDRYWIQLLRYVSSGRISAAATPSITIKEDQIEPNTPIKVMVDFANSINHQSVELIAELQTTNSEVGLPSDVSATKFFQLDRVSGFGSKHQGTISFGREGQWKLTVNSPNQNTQRNTSPITTTVNVSTIATELLPIPPGDSEMRLAAEIGGGQFRWIDEADELQDLIPRKASINLRPIAPLPIWNSYWILGALVSLITLDWLAQRYLRCDV